jgi:peptidyl-Lys metalloendopeptidase
MKIRHVSALATGAVLSIAIAAALSSATAAPMRSKSNPLRVSMMSLGGGQVEIVVTNTSRKTARVPAYALPSAELGSNLFAISRAGEVVRYEGAMIKRGVPTAVDFAILRPGQSRRTVVDLGVTYDLSKAGDYTVTFASPLQYASMSDGARLNQANGSPMVALSAPMRVFMDGSNRGALKLREIAAKKRPSGGSSVVNGVAYAGCSSTQINDAGNAVNSARGYSENAKGYLNVGTVGPRYTSWFGAYTASRYGTARQNFAAIDSAMDQSNGQITINCGCNQSYYAYVYPTRPYEIFVCRAFWSAPNTGTDSKAGTLIHEMSHFNVVAGTDDWAYGQTAARNLASSDPSKALDNADNHEYFAENTPSQN